MKTARYTQRDGTKIEVEYDETAPCVGCGEPVASASMGGTALCPWCDCGNCRYCGFPFGFQNPKEHVERCKADRIRLMQGQKVAE